MLETDKKRELIIEGAIKRFIHFGINKTTMNEIAEDLSVSKPSLYYYFPDKTSLILGVMEKIFDDYFNVLYKDQKQGTPLETTLLNIIEIKHKFFLRYYMLHLSYGNPDSSLSSVELKNYLETMMARNLKFHESVFETAVAKNEIAAQEDIPKLAELYLATQSGLTSLCIMHGNKELFPGKKELKLMKEKQVSLSKIFIKGLKN
ncbi:TetR/AcrR family transcriptional regulator [Pedobacter sp. MC2016-15]|jgi:TetR/AcrR family transcriptional repressor of mexJK operon|uniref:TetR/AcrR family transcriptional regulator n=1 Tax=Pedobacter sp. MC2016-15 TaxID=2994473 RepID=UPI0022483360|nr:TetR/AcrR family transcriptional regulator [Pedobacter sp. MC2016-15]MCX2481313.1 TetR/AcrR family transcriptional regulator [Pedobacter sp. MC2016-15]